MSEWNVKKLDTLCREIRKKYPRLPVLAIQWIYATNSQNPVLGELDRVCSFSVAFSLLLRIPWLVLRGFPLVLRITWLRLFLSPLLSRLRAQSFNVLSKTWAFPSSKEKSGKDFYLGELAPELNKRGISFLTIYGNATDKHWLRLIWPRRAFEFPYQIPELCLLSPFSVVAMLFKQIAAALVLFWKAVFEKESDSKKLLLVVSRDCLRYLTLRNALFYRIGKRAAAYWKPKFFLTLYEGNAWEKCLALGVREKTPLCRMIGYQHTVIMEHALELRSPSNSIVPLRPPELILATGTHPIALMQPGHEPFGSRFIPFGTFRYPLSHGGASKPRPSQKTLLVLPEGILAEMIILFNAALGLASLLPHYRICLRCHPVLSFERVKKYLQSSLEKHPNVFLSAAVSIETDFDSSSTLLYRGTSAVLTAVLKGLKPFYFISADAEENRDPLFELSSWRECVSSVEGMARRVKDYDESRKEENEENWRKAVRYVQSYVKPVGRESYNQLAEHLQ